MLWKYWFGWTPEAEIRRLAPPFTTAIGPADRTTTVTKLLFVPVAPMGMSPTANTPQYTLELITGAGLNAGQDKGLAIRYIGNALPQNRVNVVKYIDTLKAGETFVDPHRGIKIELIRVLSGLVAQIRVCNTTPGVASDGSFSSTCIN
jgi:hypothetical protein